MEVRLTEEEILRYSTEYDYEDDRPLTNLLASAVKRGFMTRDDLVAVARWKWRGGRTWQLAEENSEDEVQEITRVAFSAESERLRIGALLALRGVNWPMASVILHFAFPDRYPILDVRVMRSVDGSTVYTFERWLMFTHICREKAGGMGISLRSLDRALWAADKARKPQAAYL